MASSETWFACENGHPVLSGSTICTKCGGQVTSRRVPPPESSRKPSREITDLPAPSGSPVPSSGDSGSPSSASSPNVQKRTTLIVVLAAGISTLIAGAVFAVVAAQSSDTAEPVPSVAAIPMACTGVVPELVVGVEYEDAPAVSCFVVDEETTVTVTARSFGGEGLGLEVERVDGVFWAGTPGSEGVDSVLSSFFLPGAYVVTVVGEDGAAPKPFTLTTAVDDTEPLDLSDPSLPGVDECGNAVTPFLELDAGVSWLSSDGSVVNACVTVDEAAFVKVGAEANERNAADLSLAVHEFGPDGRPVFVRSVFDTFGLDPELSLDLEAGTYLLEVWEQTKEPVGGFELYASTDPEYYRPGEVSEARTGLTPDDCASGDILSVAIGRSLIFTTDDPVACVTVEVTERLILKAVSFSGQDLTLEVIGFGDDGTPFRFSWIDDDLWAANIDDLDPVLDINVPAGTYVLSVAEFNGETPRDLMIAIDEGGESAAAR